MRAKDSQARRIGKLLVLTLLGLLLLYRIGDALESGEQRKHLLWFASEKEEFSLGRPSERAEIKRLTEVADAKRLKRNTAIFEIVILLSVGVFIWTEPSARPQASPQVMSPDKPS